MVSCTDTPPCPLPAPGEAFAQGRSDDVEVVAHHVAGGVYYLAGQGGNIGVSVGEVHAAPLPPGHTDGDSYIHFRDEQVIHVGDVFRTVAFPVIDRNRGPAAPPPRGLRLSLTRRSAPPSPAAIRSSNTAWANSTPEGTFPRLPRWKRRAR